MCYFTQLRAQNQVLKKAVVDEQANTVSLKVKHKHVHTVLLFVHLLCLILHDILKDQLKQRDQSLRKQEQEMDSLSFRNQQLAKRVELLQEELAASEAKGKKGKVIMKRPSEKLCVCSALCCFISSYFHSLKKMILGHINQWNGI